ncbi:MAG: dephospho-CoA kinase, partial [Actinobacteria bacterium]|nr:dephospho-CoA kinase [Actinomycetota bacterium]
MLTVAVTGGIGSGKSLVGDYLEALGAIVIDSDQL